MSIGHAAGLRYSSRLDLYQLISEFPGTLNAMADAIPGPQLPRWRCHKEVNAAKIVRIENTTIGARLHFDGGQSVEVNLLWQDRHRPQVGGYFVMYNDGHRSYSPAKAFEEGYTLINTAHS